MRIRHVLPVLLYLSFATTAAAAPLSEPDRIRLSEAFRLADAMGNEVWPGWSAAPFAVLLVTPEQEFLIRHPAPSPDFVAGDYDSLLGSRIYVRPRVFSPGLQATFPAVGGVSTVVISPAEGVTPRQSSTRWVLTVMHEHFHQWQDTQPGAQAALDSLQLAKGDQTGMWMLNYPFPYADTTISGAFDKLSRLAAAALRARGTPKFSAAYAAFDSARVRFIRLLKADDARYLDFQLWKEGVARYTEYEVARVAASRYKPSERFKQLSDFTSFDTEAGAALDRILHELDTLHLSDWQRTVVYPLGAAEALLLDARRPGWKTGYVPERYSMDRLVHGRP